MSSRSGLPRVPQKRLEASEGGLTGEKTFEGDLGEVVSSVGE